MRSLFCLFTILTAGVFAQAAPVNFNGPSQKMPADVVSWTGLTEDFPPFNYFKDGKISGFSTEIARELFQMQKVPMEVKMGPWNEYFEKTKKTPAHFIFTTARTPEREKLFKWVGPLARDTFYLVAPIDSKINPTSDLNELRKFKVSGFEGDYPVLFLEKNGFKVLHIEDDKIRYAKLKKGELDLDILSEISQPAYEKIYGLKFKRIGRLYRQDYYLAFNNSTSDEVIAQFNGDLRKFRKTDKFQQLRKEFLPMLDF